MIVQIYIGRTFTTQLYLNTRLLQSIGRTYKFNGMKILFLGEIVGRCGIGVIKKSLKKFRAENDVDYVIANGEGATSGYGLGFQNSQSLHYMGIDVFVLGEKAYYKVDMVEGISKRDKILRPANFPETAPGRGVHYYMVGNKKICVINMLGMMGFTNPHLNNPFLVSQAIVDRALTETNLVIYVFHSQATAEKQAMFHLLRSKVSAVIGTHTKAITADAQIVEGTAYISDMGRCGSSDSVGGFEPEHEIKKYRTQISVRSHESWERPQLQGVLVDFDDNTGKAVEIKTVKQDVECTPPSES